MKVRKLDTARPTGGDRRLYANQASEDRWGESNQLDQLYNV